jgi:hypothetical protein
VAAAVTRRKGRGNDCARRRGGFQIVKRAMQDTRGNKPVLLTSLWQSGTHYPHENLRSRAMSSHCSQQPHSITSDKNRNCTLSPCFLHNWSPARPWADHGPRKKEKTLHQDSPKKASLGPNKTQKLYQEPADNNWDDPHTSCQVSEAHGGNRRAWHEEPMQRGGAWEWTPPWPTNGWSRTPILWSIPTFIE